MKRIVSIMIVAMAVAFLGVGCFKSVIAYTFYNIAVYEQTEQNGKTPKAEDLFSYAYYVDTTEWKIASWEDACQCRITNKLTGEVREEPDRIGDFVFGRDYQVSMKLNEDISMLVVVNPTLQMYAYRKYELPINLEKVDTKLYFAAFKRSHTACGWQIINPFFGQTEE